MNYGVENLRIQHRVHHPMQKDKNPYCAACGFRMMPDWGPHTCINKIDIDNIRHWAGMAVSNFHFYRVPPALQAAALIEALGFVLGGTVINENVALRKMEKTYPYLRKLIKHAAKRAATGKMLDNPVMEIHAPRLKIKKRGDRSCS